MIQFEKLTKKYGNNFVLNDIYLEIFDGDFIIFYGDNGSGKSTLLKIISQVIIPQNKKMITSSFKKCSYIAEKILLPKNIKSYDYIKLLSDKDETLCYEFISKYELPNKEVGKLSKGNLQKVAIILSFLSNCSLLVFDEPTEGMDELTLNLFIKDLFEYHNQGKTIVISTHNVKDYKKIKGRKIKVENGKCIE